MGPALYHPLGHAHHERPDGQSLRINRRVLLLLGCYSSVLHAGIARYAREAGWAINNQYVRGGYPPLWWHGDGIIGLITTPKDVRAVECFPKLPMVDLSKGWISDSMPAADRVSGMEIPRVLYDNIKIARMAAEHFLQRGYKHIAFLNMGNYWHETERIPTIRQMIVDAGGDFHEIPYYQHLPAAGNPAPTEPDAAHAWLVDTLIKLSKPLGIVVGSDDDSERLLQACQKAGVAVPEEIGILGSDNDPLVCDYTPVTLSSVDIDWDSIGYEAASLLDRLMDGESAPVGPILVPPKGVVTRMSTNILAVPDPKIARALRFIWENFASPIGTAEVAAAANLNRRKLERDFRFHLHRTVANEILRNRIERAKVLLVESGWTTHRIAVESGFSDVTPFSNAFVRFTGIRPGAFRRANATSAPLPPDGD